MKWSLVILTFSLMNISCVYDPVFKAEILNNSNDDIILEVTFDKDSLAKHWGNNSYIPFLNSYPNWTNIQPAIYSDTINLVYQYKIKPTITFLRNELKKNLKEVEKRHWVLNIK